MEPSSSSSRDEEPQLSLILGDSSLENLIFVIFTEISDLEKVRQARTQIQTCLDRSPNATYRKLVNLLSCSSMEIKGYTAKFLAKLLNAPDSSFWYSLQDSTRIEVKTKLLEFVVREEDALIREQLVLAITKLGTWLLTDNGWIQFFPFVFQSIDSSVQLPQIAGLSIISHIARAIPDSLVPHLDSLHAIFFDTLSSHNIDIKIASIHAVANFSNSPDFGLPTFQSLVPLIIDAIRTCLHSQNFQMLISDIRKLLYSSRLHGIETSYEFGLDLEHILFLLCEDDKSIKILESPNIEPFENLILEMMSPDDDLKSHALDHIQLLKKNRLCPFIFKLSLTLCVSANPLIKEKLVRFLRKELKLIWPHMEPSWKAELKASLLGCYIDSDDRALLAFLRFLINDMISVPSIGWLELPDQLIRWADSDIDHYKQRAFDLLAVIASHIADVGFLPLNTMFNLFSNSLSCVETIDVRMSALSACTEYICYISLARQLRACQDLVPKLVQVLSDASKFGEYSLLDRGLDSLSDLARAHPSVLNINMDITVQTFLHIAENIAWGRCCFRAVGFLLLLAEYGFLLGSPQSSASRLFGVLLRLVYEEVLHAPQNATYESEPEDENRYLTRLARSASMINGRIRDVALGKLYLYAESTEWQKRYAAVIAINRMSRGLVVGNLDQLVTMLLKAVGDRENNVRVAGIDCLRKLMNILGAEFRESFGERILPVLNHATNDHSDIRVQQHAHQALQEFHNG